MLVMNGFARMKNQPKIRPGCPSIHAALHFSFDFHNYGLRLVPRTEYTPGSS